MKLYQAPISATCAKNMSDAFSRFKLSFFFQQISQACMPMLYRYSDLKVAPYAVITQLYSSSKCKSSSCQLAVVSTYRLMQQLEINPTLRAPCSTPQGPIEFGQIGAQPFIDMSAF